MKLAKHLKTGAAVLALGLVATAAQAEEMVFTSWGGQTQDLQKQHWAEPFTAATGIAVAHDGPTDYGKLQAMVESGNVTWDLVDVEADFAAKAGNDGLLEPIDFSIVDRSQLDPRFVTDYSVGSFSYAFVLGYDVNAYQADQPKDWSALFDLEKYPGKRSLYKWSGPGVLEAALLADGVAPEDLYPLDLDRAFAKLDTIKSEIIWWSTGAQSQQLLASGEVSIGQFWCGRVFLLQATGTDVGISWEQNLTSADSLVVPKGSKNKEAAMKFIALATSAEAQASFAVDSGNSPINVNSAALMPAEYAEKLPENFSDLGVDLDLAYWAANRDEIGARWYAWQAE